MALSPITLPGPRGSPPHQRHRRRRPGRLFAQQLCVLAVLWLCGHAADSGVLPVQQQYVQAVYLTVCRVGRSGGHERLPGACPRRQGQARWPTAWWRAPCVVIPAHQAGRRRPHGDRARPSGASSPHWMPVRAAPVQSPEALGSLPVGLVTLRPRPGGFWGRSTAHAGALRTGHPHCSPVSLSPSDGSLPPDCPSCFFRATGSSANIDPQTAGHGLQSRHDSERPPSRPCWCDSVGAATHWPAWSQSGHGRRRDGSCRGRGLTGPGLRSHPRGIGPSLTQGLTVGLAASVAGLVVLAIGDREQFAAAVRRGRARRRG